MPFGARPLLTTYDETTLTPIVKLHLKAKKNYFHLWPRHLLSQCEIPDFSFHNCATNPFVFQASSFLFKYFMDERHLTSDCAVMKILEEHSYNFVVHLMSITTI